MAGEAYAVVCVVLVEGALDSSRLERSLACTRHDACFERLAWHSEPRDLFDRLLEAIASTPCDGRWRVGLASMSEHMHLLLIGAHPTYGDANALLLMLDEVIAAYERDAAPAAVPGWRRAGASRRGQTRHEAFRVCCATHLVSRGVLCEIERVAERHGVTRAAVLLAGWLAVLPRLTGDAPLPCGIHPRMPFVEILSRVGNHAEAYASVLFEHYADTSTRTACGVRFSVQRLYACTERFRIKLSAWTRDAGLVLDLQWDAAQVAADHASALLSLYAGRLEEIACAGASGASVPLVSEREWHAVLATFNRTEAARPFTTYANRFAEQVARTPDAIAVRAGQATLTYRALDHTTTRLARQLMACGIESEDCVGLHLASSPQLAMAQLAVLNAGAAFVPLDPSEPRTHLHWRAAQAQVSLIVTTSELADVVRDAAPRILRLDVPSDLDAPAATASTAWPVCSSAQLACVIFTSEATGVQVEQRALMNYLDWAATAYGSADSGPSVLYTPPGFDVTVRGLVPWLTGQTLDVPDDEAVVWWQPHAPRTGIIHEYAPTNAVVGCCVYAPPSDEPERGPVPIGRPIANTQVYVLDADGQPTPPGLPGELSIGGAAVPRGYLRQPVLTAARLVPDPFSGVAGSRLCRTGDLGRHRVDGTLEYLGHRISGGLMDEDNRTYMAVVNQEEQYSIWRADQPLPTGWRQAGKTGTKRECLDYIAVVWTDMRPLSLRHAIASRL